jgi:hypothetical protein
MPGVESPRTERTALAIALVAAAAVWGQDGTEPLRLQGVFPTGLRTSATESRGTLHFTVTNPNSTPRDARVVVLFPSRAEVQYGRDVWVPGRASLSTWLPVGPAPEQPTAISREIQVLLFDRTSGPAVPVLPPGEERVRSRPVLYRKREPTTAILLDPAGTDLVSDPLARAESRAALLLARTCRRAAGLSDHVSMVSDGFLPPTPDAFDGIDHFILAGNRLATDPVGRSELRRWVQHGGKVWVMLDLVDPAVVAPILGDDFDMQVVDRVGLTTVTIRRHKDDSVAAPAREFEEPVELVRVVPSGGDRVVHTVTGWPASIVRQVGRGKVLFTTLGPAAWHQPRPGSILRRPQAAEVPASDLPVPTTPLDEIAVELHSPPGFPALTADHLRPLLTEEIGYSVVGRGPAALVLGGFLVVLVGLGIGLRRAVRSELVGWLGVTAALAAAGVFLVLGERARRAVPPTVGLAEVVDVVPGSGEAAAHGVFAVYQPSSGPSPIRTRRGGVLRLDTEGLDGQLLRQIQTDTDAWHLEDLSLPAGVRTGQFRYTARPGRVEAVARFGPTGIEGRLTPGTFRDPGDAILISPSREPIATRLGADGDFASGPADTLAADQFLAGTVLTDRQQRRQAVYRQLLSGPLPEHLQGRDLMLAWAEPAELPFAAVEDARVVSTALLVVPLQFERPTPGTHVVIPRGFVPHRRLVDGRPALPTLESTAAIDMRLRFQLPPSVLPLEVERATLVARVRAPGRRFAVAGVADGELVPLVAVDSPTEPVRLEITESRLLRRDAQGGLLLNVAVTGPGDGRWAIEALGLEVVGRTGDR